MGSKILIITIYNSSVNNCANAIQADQLNSAMRFPFMWTQNGLTYVIVTVLS